MAADKLQKFALKPRIFALTDASNETNDTDSLVRYLLYANQFETEGLVACTSTLLKKDISPKSIHKVIDAYALVVDNLNVHVHPEHPYPPAEHLRTLVKIGPATYGMNAVGDNVPLSDGAALLYQSIVKPSSQPLWVLCWGGTNALAQVLLYVDCHFSPEDSQRLMSRLRVYAISDRDDSSAWIRMQFPDVFCISSVHGWKQYGMATWTGISGDRHFGFDQGGPDLSKFRESWIKDNVQIGPLGSVYPDSNSILEGGTPTFLHLVQNGLGMPDSPEYGSWGGRYIRTDGSASSMNGNHYSDAVDRVKGLDGRTYISNHATIWRWRDVYQDDFAVRVRWSIEPDFSKAAHHPVVFVNDDAGLHPLRLEAEAGSSLVLDTSKTYDPDATSPGSPPSLTFTWWQYREPTATQWTIEDEVAELGVKLLDKEGRKVEVTVPPAEKSAVDFATIAPVAKGQLLHLILTVRGSSTPPLTTYRRVLIQVTNKALKGRVEVSKGSKGIAPKSTESAGDEAPPALTPAEINAA